MLRRNQNGQIAIFLVLVFQVLFIFFAMSINVGLVVYDKINLQNATDLAAYYAAQKQAEMLNQIGHINYQIRQAYKLLAFRVRVIGSAGIGLPDGSLPRHPIFSPPNTSGEGTAFHPRLGTSRFAPGVCIGNSLWHEYKITEGANTASVCRTLEGFSSVPLASGGGDPLGLIGGLNGFLQAIQGELEQKCRVVGVLNWQLATSFLMAYVLEANRRTDMIMDVAGRLSQPGAQMTDFSGQSVFQGSLNTLKKNLTDPQKETLNMQLFNSLSQDVGGNCGNSSDGGFFWLPKIEIFPVVTYVKMDWIPAGNYGFCQTIVTPNRSAQSMPTQQNMNLVPARNNALMQQAWTNPNPISMGVEKNPWCMPYMAIKAQTSPRKIFSPFGDPVVLKAEAFAKPFGGRIGPWYNSVWPSGSPTSQGGTRLDPLLPARSISGNRTPGDPADDLVNYSKYPGDPNGLNSQYALASMHGFWQQRVINNAPANRVPAAFALAHYNHIGDPDYFDRTPDSLVRQNGSPVSADPIRQMEEVSVVPDLFDITYYSVEAQYSSNYFNPQHPTFRSSIDTGRSFLDIGSQDRQPYSVFDQINRGRDLYGNNIPFYLIDNPNHLLTGWAQHRAADYSFPVDAFGKCLRRRDDEMMDTPGPGGCPHGGRSGYSVKIVSKKYLQTVSAPLGGEGQSGPILNAPEF